MTIQDQIDALLAEAAPLRLLPDEEAEEKGLPKIVDRINALRAVQAAAVASGSWSPLNEDKIVWDLNPLVFPPGSPGSTMARAEAAADEAAFEAERAAVKRKPGRPKKDEAA